MKTTTTAADHSYVVSDLIIMISNYLSWYQIKIFKSCLWWQNRMKQKPQKRLYGRKQGEYGRILPSSLVTKKYQEHIHILVLIIIGCTPEKEGNKEEKKHER